MWLKRLVAISLIITAIGMVGISIAGVVKGDTSIDRLGTSGAGSLGKGSKIVGSSELAPASSASSGSSSSDSSQNSTSNNPSISDTGQNNATNSAGSGTGGTNTSPTSASGSTTTAGSGTATGGGSSGGGTSGGSSPAPTPAKPVVNITVSPGTITAGASSTIGWSASNSPSSCTAGGSWSGTKGASGSQSTGTISSAGTKTYSLTCVNAGGSATASVNLTVNATPVAYCGGIDPNLCIGVSAMNSHSSSSNCWAYSKYNRSGAYASVFNLNAAPSNNSIAGTHGLKRISSGNFYSKCGQDMTSCLNGSGGCGSSKNHSSGNMSSYSQTFIGYFDPAKP